jgi:hypothetical protein
MALATGSSGKQRRSAIFCEQKVAKNFIVSPPPAQRQKNFCAAFFKKRLLPSL